MVSKLKKASIAIRQNSKRDNSPKWDNTESWTGEQFGKHFHLAMEWYRMEKSVKELKPLVINWMSANGYDKETISAFKKTKDFRCNSTTGGIAANLLKGMPAFHPDFNKGRNAVEWLKEQIDLIIESGKDDFEEEIVDNKKPIAPVPSIQDRLRDSASNMSEELDAAIDNFITDPDSFDPKSFKIVNLLRGKGAKAAHARLIKTFFQPGYSELQELASGSADDQLREGYKHLARKNVKKLIEFYEMIMSACDQIAAEAKVLKKPRAKKIKPAEELVKKLKFKTVDDKLGLVSVPPASIIGSQYTVVYNTKTRKFGIYVATDQDGIGVKGASLTNFTEKSLQKTFRKPPEQIKQFRDLNTARRIQEWFGKIKSVETKLNGRINADTMILKVFK